MKQFQGTCQELQALVISWLTKMFVLWITADGLKKNPVHLLFQIRDNINRTTEWIWSGFASISETSLWHELMLFFLACFLIKLFFGLCVSGTTSRKQQLSWHPLEILQRKTRAMPGSHGFMDASNFSRMFAKQRVVIAAVNQTHTLIYPHLTPAYRPSLACSGAAIWLEALNTAKSF